MRSAARPHHAVRFPPTCLKQHARGRTHAHIRVLLGSEISGTAVPSTVLLPLQSRWLPQPVMV
jgi:hypothetical protein